MNDLFETNGLVPPASSELPVIRNYYLRKILVISDEGNCLPSIQHDGDDDDESFDERNVQAQLNRFSSVLTDGSISNEGRKMILDHMRRKKIHFFTEDSFDKDRVLKSKLTVKVKKEIRNYFTKEQFHIDKVLAEEGRFQQECNNTSVICNDDDMDEDEINNEEDEDDNDENDSYDNTTSISTSTTLASKDNQPINVVTTPIHNTRSTKRQASSTPSLSTPTSPAKKKKGKRSLTPKNTVRSKKSDFAKVNVYTSVKVPSKTVRNEGKFMVLVTTDNGSGENLFAWRPAYLKPVFELFQDDFESGEFLVDDVTFEVYEQCEEPQSDDQKQSGNKYSVDLLAMIFPYTKETCHKAGLAFRNHGKNEKDFVKKMFDSFWDNMVKDELFEPRLINCIERASLSSNSTFDEEYPKRRFRDYTSRVAQCLARDKTTKKKRSDNFDKLENPEKSFHWDVPISDLIIKSTVEHIVLNDLVVPRGPKKEDSNLFERFTGLSPRQMSEDV